MARITNKREMYDLFLRGMFGCNGLNFDTLEAAEKHGGWLAIRSRNAGMGGGLWVPWVKPAELREVVDGLQKQGYQFADLQISARMPDDQLIMQAYLRRTENYFDLDYSDTPGLDMRTGMQQAKHLKGIAAVYFLRTRLQDEYENLVRLFDDYPDAVLEFTVYTCFIDGFKRLVVWEVRDY